jgi:hypothetical protein
MKAKALRLVREHAVDYPTEHATITSRTTLPIFLAGRPGKPWRSTAKGSLRTVPVVLAHGSSKPRGLAA